MITYTVKMMSSQIENKNLILPLAVQGDSTIDKDLQSQPER